MSFQDFSSPRRTAQQPSSTNVASNTNFGSTGRMVSGPPLSGNSSNSNNSSGPAGLAQISEVLLQYQRNVGILEKIVQSLTVSARQQLQRGMISTGSSQSEELNLQYQAQVDVIGQLENKVKRLFSKQDCEATASQTRTALIKLQRDFERVQNRAQALISGMTKLQNELHQVQRHQQQQRALGQKLDSTTSPYNNNYDQQQQQPMDHYQQVQLQLQQDRLAESIMREREEEIRNINRGMHQVNEIYKDLANIVGNQQEQVDQIETQMSDAKHNAESGLTQVQKANENFGNSQCVVS